MYFMGSDWRKRRTMFDPSHYSIENYCTDTKKDMKHSFGEELLNNLHLLPDPLKKNLADSLITTDLKPKQSKKMMLNVESVESVMPKAKQASAGPGASPLPTLSGITSFFSGVMNVISSAMFMRRSPSPPRYYDCYEETNVSRQGSPVSWQPASAEDQNKNVRAHVPISNSETDLLSDMSKDCHDAAAQCEDKLNRLRLLLKSKPVETPSNCTRRPRKPSVSPPQQKTVIELGSVENSPNIQDDLTFATEINGDDLSSVKNSPAIQSLDRLSNGSVNSLTDKKDYFNEILGRFHSTSATESEDSFQIVFSDSPQTRPRVPSDCESEDSFIVFEEESPDSCYTSNDVFGNESELDADYSDSDTDASDSGCVPVTKLAHNLSRTFGDLTDDALYDEKPVDEVDCAVKTVCEEIPTEDLKDISEVCETDNEVKSTGLLLNDAKKLLKKSLPPKNYWADKKCTLKKTCAQLGHSMRQTGGGTAGNLPVLMPLDQRLVAVMGGLQFSTGDSHVAISPFPSTVHFSPLPPKVHVMRVWAFAARQARAGHWERCAIDRDRFKRRIADVDMAVSWVLKPQHRSRVMFQRFMPWWNAQKRKEIADKKQKDAEDKLQAEKEEEELRLRAETLDLNDTTGKLINGDDNTMNGVEELVVEHKVDVQVRKYEKKEQKPFQNALSRSSIKRNKLKKFCDRAVKSANTDTLKIVAVNRKLNSKLDLNKTQSDT